MHGGFNVLAVSGCLIAAGCVTNTGKLQVRAIPDQATSLRTGSGDLAQAKSLLALGSVGLALEGFRKTLRSQPSNAEAMAGIAACYAAMGRYDLAQSNYEAALAQTPQDPKLLMALADSLAAQGKNSEAATARADAVRTTRLLRPKTSPPASVPAVAQPAPPAVARLADVLLQVLDRSVVSSSSVTVRLPPARSAETARTRTLEGKQVAASAPTAAGRQSVPAYLERLSTGEVALVTTGRPFWQPQLTSRTALKATVRWVPIQSAAAGRTGIHVLNAARSGGLAARARSVLFDRGWRDVSIGDALQVRANSIVYYPADRSALGRRLAAQFGIHTLLQRETGGLVVLLGRDAAGFKAAQRRG